MPDEDDDDDDGDDDDGDDGLGDDDDDDDDAGPGPATNCVDLGCVECEAQGGTCVDGVCSEPQACCLPVEDDADDDDDGDDRDGVDGVGDDDDDDDDDDDSICLDIDPLCCTALGGTPLGPRSQCVVDDDDDDDGDGEVEDGKGDDAADDDDDDDDDNLRCPEPLPPGASKATSSGTSQTDTAPVSAEGNSPVDSFGPSAGGCGGLGMISLFVLIVGLIGLRSTRTRQR